jgi:hypothetical protein
MTRLENMTLRHGDLGRLEKPAVGSTPEGKVVDLPHATVSADPGGRVNTSIATAKVNTPWHLWVTGTLALLWNCVGAFDYVMTQMRNASYLSSFTPEQLAYVDSFPKWVVATWALSVWGGVVGSILLLLRKRLAVPVFAISLAAMVPTFFYYYVLTDSLAVMGGVGGLLFTGVVVVVGIALLVYARNLASKGLLR